jgi:ribosomal protein S18 acetylase RimI-like enzyme
LTIRPITAADRALIEEIGPQRWSGDIVVVHDTTFRPAGLPGFLAEEDGEVVGLLTYAQVTPDTVEVVTIDAFDARNGVGTELLAAAVDAAAGLGARQVVLTTTNDNVDALRFYQRRGFRLTGLRPGALAATRRLKPQVPLTGNYGIPLTDELELTRSLDPQPSAAS